MVPTVFAISLYDLPFIDIVMTQCLVAWFTSKRHFNHFSTVGARFFFDISYAIFQVYPGYVFACGVTNCKDDGEMTVRGSLSPTA